jgi:hypothetical protein
MCGRRKKKYPPSQTETLREEKAYSEKKLP